jgi:hypothetical protein
MSSATVYVGFAVTVAVAAIVIYFVMKSHNESKDFAGTTDAEPAVDMARRASPIISGDDSFVKKMNDEHKQAKKAGFDHPRAQLFAQLRMASTMNSGAGHQLQGPKVSAAAVRTEEARHLPLFRINARYSEAKESLFLQLNGRKKPAYKLNKPITLSPNEDMISKTTTITTLERKD